MKYSTSLTYFERLPTRSLALAPLHHAEAYGR